MKIIIIGLALIVSGGLIWVICLKPTIIITIIGYALVTIGVIFVARGIKR